MTFERFLREFLEWSAALGFLAVIGFALGAFLRLGVMGAPLLLGLYTAALAVWLGSTYVHKRLFPDPSAYTAQSTPEESSR